MEILDFLNVILYNNKYTLTKWKQNSDYFWNILVRDAVVQKYAENDIKCAHIFENKKNLHIQLFLKI